MALTLQERRKTMVLTSAAGLGMMALAVLLVNVLGNWAFFRLDLTERQAYSLSGSSKKLVRELSDPVIVKAYFTAESSRPYNAYERYVRDLLVEYRSASRGKVKFEFALQSPPQEFEKKASEAGLLPIQFEQMGADQLQIRRGYMGLVLFHRDKSETLAIVKDVQQLEYDITSRIAKMAQRTKKVLRLPPAMARRTGKPVNPSSRSIWRSFTNSKTCRFPGPRRRKSKPTPLLIVGSKQKWDDKSLWAWIR